MLKQLRRLVPPCCRRRRAEKRPAYIKGFLRRTLEDGEEDDAAARTIPMRRASIHNPQLVTMICLEMGEVCMGLGLIAEVLRYPPSPGRNFWTLSYAVWNDNFQSRLLWRKFFADVAAFFYVINGADRLLLPLIKAELDEFVTMPRNPEFPRFLILIFLNRPNDSEGMTLTEIEQTIIFDYPKCVGYLIQPIRGRKSIGFRKAAGWLHDQLVANAEETTSVYPDQIARERTLSSGAVLGAFPTFNLNQGGNGRDSLDSDESWGYIPNRDTGSSEISVLRAPIRMTDPDKVEAVGRFIPSKPKEQPEP